MDFLLNAKQMKYCDQETIEKIGIPSLVLMERAALCTVEELHREAFDLSSVLVVCGSGNNGGDGFAIARILDEQGVRVTVAFAGREESMSPETSRQKKICENCGIKISSNFRQHEYTTIVDAIFGIGLSRAVEGHYAELIAWINQQPARVAAVDMPSGVCADTGKILGTAVMADLTVTFAYRKVGQVLYPGTACCGQVVRRDIGITAERFSEGMNRVFAYETEDLQRIAHRRAYSNKGTYGRVLLIAGSRGMSGAALLSALAAYRSGSGLVRIFTPECNREVLQAGLPEAIVSTYDPENVQQEKLQGLLDWADVAGIGPGLGTGSGARQILEYVRDHFSRPLVIDADGLNLLAESREADVYEATCGTKRSADDCGADGMHRLSDRNAGRDLLHGWHCPVIVTPHIGEMTRLTGRGKDEILEDIVESARSFAGAYRMICVLKDARTIVSDGSRGYVNVSGNSGMAVAGAGDILTGIICGLLAQGMQPFDGAALGVYLHGLAGDLARETKGAYGMIARDIAEQIGEVLKQAED